MTLHIRALERALICQRTQLRVTPAVHTFVGDWEQASEQAQPPPDALDLLRGVATAGVIPLTPRLVVGYLDQCQHQTGFLTQNACLALSSTASWNAPSRPNPTAAAASVVPAKAGTQAPGTPNDHPPVIASEPE